MFHWVDFHHTTHKESARKYQTQLVKLPHHQHEVKHFTHHSKHSTLRTTSRSKVGRQHQRKLSANNYHREQIIVSQNVYIKQIESKLTFDEIPKPNSHFLEKTCRWNI